MPKKLSTNDKLNLILNGPDDIDDPSAQAKIVYKETKAKNRLRRTSLYGSGARAKIPILRRSYDNIASPFALSDTKLLNTQPLKAETISIPPGAHDDQYRLIQSQTTANRNNPDRVFYQSQLINPSIRQVDQPPWYLGNQNKIVPPDNSMILAASRYGYRGSKGIKQYLTAPYEPPERTKTPYTPKFLEKKEKFIDEYAPPLQMKPMFNGYHPNLVSPKLWPESAVFVTGYPKKELPTSVYYSRESTLSSTVPPKTPAAALAVEEKREKEDHELFKLAQLERSRTIMNRPMTQQASMESSWRKRVEEIGTPMLRSTMRDFLTHEHKEPHTLMDETDSLRYSGASALIVHSQSTEDLKFRLMMDRIESSTPYALRWRQTGFALMNIKRRLKRDQALSEGIYHLANHLRSDAIANGSESTLSRVDFLKSIQKTQYFEHSPAKQSSLLFSVFDPLKKDRIRFADFIASLTALDKPNDNVIDKMSSIWNVYEEFGANMPILDMALTILTVCANSDDDIDKISWIFRENFRPLCYNLSVNIDPEVEFQRSINAIKKNRPDTKKRNKSSNPAYSICEEALDIHLFRFILSKLPELTNIVDLQLSERLVQCYGKDVRKIDILAIINTAT